MIADEQVTTEPSSLFSAQDQAAIRAQLKKRLILVLIPAVLGYILMIRDFSAVRSMC